MSLPKDICAAFVERAEALGYKGKARDRAALDYIIGAAKAFEVAGDADKAEWLGRIAWLVSVRGYGEVKEIANG